MDENVRQIYMNSEANQGGDLSREPRGRLEFPEAVHVISYGPPPWFECEFLSHMHKCNLCIFLTLQTSEASNPVSI